MDPVVTQTAKGGWFGSRSDFHLSIPTGEKKSVEVDISGVRTYGTLVGWALYQIGFASYTPTGSYVNTKSFFKHLADAAVLKQTQMGKDVFLRSSDLSNNILEDKSVKKSLLTADSIKEIFGKCIVGGKYHPKIVFEQWNPQKNEQEIKVVEVKKKENK